MTARETLVEMVALSLFLVRKRLCRALLESPPGGGDDQRRGVDLQTAAARFRDLPAHLREEGRRCRARALGLLDAAAAAGIEPVGWRDARYPGQLLTLDDRPPVVWLKGDAGALARPSVAIVGSRAASPYAVAVAERLASELSGCGIVVVSGCARGVDAAAHRGALGGEGATIAVLGSGVDVVYPAEHRELARSIVRAGALMSEFPPGTPPLRHHFPPAQSPDQRARAGGGGRRGRRPQRLAHHRAVRGGAGPGGDGRARERSQRAQRRGACPDPRRGGDRGDGGGYPGGDRIRRARRDAGPGRSRVRSRRRGRRRIRCCATWTPARSAPSTT